MINLRTPKSALNFFDLLCARTMPNFAPITPETTPSLRVLSPVRFVRLCADPSCCHLSWRSWPSPASSPLEKRPNVPVLWLQGALESLGSLLTEANEQACAVEKNSLPGSPPVYERHPTILGLPHANDVGFYHRLASRPARDRSLEPTVSTGCPEVGPDGLPLLAIPRGTRTEEQEATTD